MMSAAPAAEQAKASADKPDCKGQANRWAPERRGWAGARPSTVPAKGCGCDDCNSKPRANPPANQFDDCPTDWQKEANAALAMGRPWVANAATGLASLPTPVPAPVATALNRHFHTTAPDDIKKILSNYQKLDNAMNASVSFECEKKCDPGVGGYVWKPFGTTVHLCPLWHFLTATEQANVIIHELSHEAANRDDEAYIWSPDYPKLSASDAIDNADSYSYFAEDSFNNTVHP